MVWPFSFRKRRKPLVYLGPSLPLARAKGLLDAEYRPPIRRGDLPKDFEEGYRTFGIVDGVFHQSLSVSIREIRLAIDQGAKLFGSSSMGALRAAETYPLGMVGVGEVYRWYRSEYIDSDDEVALVFDEASQRPLTVPLVNIRATLSRALENERLVPEIHGKVLDEAVALAFPMRNLENLLCGLSGKIPDKWLERVGEIFSAEAVDVKAQDAEALLFRIGAER